MPFHPAQLEAISWGEGPALVLAGPGSGKTTVITHRVRELLQKGADPSRILVITFTKAAAGAVSYTHLDVYKRQLWKTWSI